MWGGVWDRAWTSSGHWRNLLLTRVFGDTTSKKVLWKPTIGEKLQADQGFGNEADKFAVKVVKNNEIVSHLPREYLRTLWYFIACGGKMCGND